MSEAVWPDSREGAPMEQATRVLVVGALSATAMLFASLVSAYLVRRSFHDWRPAPASWPLGLLLLAFLASTFMEVSWRFQGAARRRGFQGLFAASGLYLALASAVIVLVVDSTPGLRAPHNAFVVLLLGVHVVHAVIGTLFSIWILRPPKGEPSGHSLVLVRLVTHSLTALLFGVVFVLFVLR